VLIVTEENRIKLSKIVENLVKRGGGKAVYYNRHIEWDINRNAEEITLKITTPKGQIRPATEIEKIALIEQKTEMHQYLITVEVEEE
jgi:hypothetical protein